jgi:hypothetical protein
VIGVFAGVTGDVGQLEGDAEVDGVRARWRQGHGPS